MTSIKKNLGYQLVYRILTVITPLITSPILSRALGAEMLGVYAATQAYVNYFVIFAMLGIEYYGNRTIAALQGDYKSQQKAFWSIYSIQFSATIAMIVLYFLSFLVIDESRISIACLQALWLLSTLLDINWFFFGCEQFKLTVTRSTIVKLLSVVCIIRFVHTPDDLWKYTLIMAGSVAISQLLLWFSLFKFISFEIPKRSNVKEHIGPIFKLFIPVIAVSIYHIMDKSMLDLMSDDINVGYYYSADKVINIPLGLTSAISTVMLPRMSKIISNGEKNVARDILRKSIELTTCLTVAIGFGIGAIANEFIPLFFGSGFDPCIQLVYLFVPVLFIKSWGELIRSQYLIPSKRDSLYTTAVIGGAITNIVANYILIKRFAAAGAVAGTMIAEFTVMAIEMIGSRKDMPFISICLSNYMYFLLGMTMAGLVRLIARFITISLIPKVIILIVSGGLIYTILCIVMWLMTKRGLFYEQLVKLIGRGRQ